jgi:hypothetical protein
MMIANTMKQALRIVRRGEPQRTEPRIVLKMERRTENAKLKPTMYLPSLSFAHRQAM